MRAGWLSPLAGLALIACQPAIAAEIAWQGATISVAFEAHVTYSDRSTAVLPISWPVYFPADGRIFVFGIADGGVELAGPGVAASRDIVDGFRHVKMVASVTRTDTGYALTVEERGATDLLQVLINVGVSGDASCQLENATLYHILNKPGEKYAIYADDVAIENATCSVVSGPPADALAKSTPESGS